MQSDSHAILGSGPVSDRVRDVVLRWISLGVGFYAAASPSPSPRRHVSPSPNGRTDLSRSQPRPIPHPHTQLNVSVCRSHCFSDVLASAPRIRPVPSSSSCVGLERTVCMRLGWLEQYRDTASLMYSVAEGCVCKYLFECGKPRLQMRPRGGGGHLITFRGSAFRFS